MNQSTSKINQDHLDRFAYIYIRQSSLRQVNEHIEGKYRQYKLVDQVKDMGWNPSKIVIVDSDQGKSGANPGSRNGFEDVIRAVASGKVGIVVALEASRLARNSPDWYNLTFMCRYTKTLIADELSVYDPSDPSDRMVLGFRGQISEMELDTSIQRMVKARWNKAERGEFLIHPPAGYELDELEQLVMSRDESVVKAVQLIFTKFNELGSARQVWHWLIKEGIDIPVKKLFRRYHPIEWNKPDYGRILRMLKNPIFAGAYAFGRTKSEKVVDENSPGKLISRTTMRSDWAVLIKDHHPAYISFEKFEENQIILMRNMTRRGKMDQGGSVREGEAVLQGITRCGHCGRSMYICYGGQRPGTSFKVYQYRCCGGEAQIGRKGCQVVGGKRVDKIVIEAFLEVVSPSSFDVVKKLNEHIKTQISSIKDYRKIQLEKANYEVLRAQRQYEAVDPENRLVARNLEKNWEEKLAKQQQAENEAEQAISEVSILEFDELEKMKTIGVDLRKIWDSETTTNRDKKKLLQCLIEEVQLTTEKNRHLVKIVWKGGKATVETVARLRGGQVNKTSESDVELIRKLAADFSDAQIARILCRQGRKPARNSVYKQSNVRAIRVKNQIPVCTKKVEKTAEGPFTLDETAAQLGVAASTVQEWLKAGLLDGKQVTAGAPWEIVLDEPTRRKLKGDDAPKGWLGLTEAAKYLGQSKSLVSYLVKSGKIDAVRVSKGKRMVWKIDVKSYTSGHQKELFDQIGDSKF